jgi:hypothetical protein
MLRSLDPLFARISYTVSWYGNETICDKEPAPPKAVPMSEDPTERLLHKRDGVKLVRVT